jgi:hypothetical protein
MVKPPAISLRIRSSEATYRARQVLRRLDDADLLQRRVKWQAVKALAAIGEMNAIAAPKLRSMPQSNRDRWRAECRMVEQVLRRISRGGV